MEIALKLPGTVKFYLRSVLQCNGPKQGLLDFTGDVAFEERDDPFLGASLNLATFDLSDSPRVPSHTHMHSSV